MRVLGMCAYDAGGSVHLGCEISLKSEVATRTQCCRIQGNGCRYGLITTPGTWIVVEAIIQVSGGGHGCPQQAFVVGASGGFAGRGPDSHSDRSEVDEARADSSCASAQLNVQNDDAVQLRTIQVAEASATRHEGFLRRDGSGHAAGRSTACRPTRTVRRCCAAAGAGESRSQKVRLGVCWWPGYAEDPEWVATGQYQGWWLAKVPGAAWVVRSWRPSCLLHNIHYAK